MTIELSKLESAGGVCSCLEPLSPQRAVERQLTTGSMLAILRSMPTPLRCGAKAMILDIKKSVPHLFALLFLFRWRGCLNNASL